MRLKMFFAWYDFWVGFYWSGTDLYFCPLPMVGIKLNFGKKKLLVPTDEMSQTDKDSLRLLAYRKVLHRAVDNGLYDKNIQEMVRRG